MLFVLNHYIFSIIAFASLCEYITIDTFQVYDAGLMCVNLQLLNTAGQAA